MIADALKYLRDKFVEGVSHEEVEVGGHDRKDRILVNGKILEFPQVPAPIGSTVHEIDSLVKSVAHFATVDIEQSVNDVTVWVQANNVHVVVDTIEDKGSIKFVPGLNSLFVRFDRLQTEHFTHDELCRLLRHDLHAAERSEEFDLAVSNLKFERNETEERNSSRTADSMGKSVRAEITGEKDIPKSVTFSFPAYPGLPDVETAIAIDCSVVLDAENKVIRIIPKPGQLDASRREAASDLRDEIETQFNGDVAGRTFIGTYGRDGR